MTNFEEEFKRPVIGIGQSSIKPALGKAVEFYTDKVKEYHNAFSDMNKYIDVIENELEKKDVEIIDLKSQLQQQSLPVVPECVAKDVKRLSLSTLADWHVAVSYISKETLEWLSTTGNINVFLGKSWTLCSLKINGFKVEKPQLFYLKNKLTGDCLAICLAKASSGLYVEVTEKWLTRKEQTSYKLYFTQQEIDSMQTGSYEQIEVTE